jgi:hypothetical protein
MLRVSLTGSQAPEPQLQGWLNSEPLTLGGSEGKGSTARLLDLQLFKLYPDVAPHEAASHDIGWEQVRPDRCSYS